MFIIGIDPHRGSHAAVVIDGQEIIQATLELPANRHQRQRLLDWAKGYSPRAWAIEGATGTGSLLAQQLVAVGERVIDVPPKLAARVPTLDNEQSDKNDRHDARSVAIAALRKGNLHDVTVEDHVAVLRLLAKRHHDLVAARTRTVCRLHATLCHRQRASSRCAYGPSKPARSGLDRTSAERHSGTSRRAACATRRRRWCR
jgi:transposase